MIYYVSGPVTVLEPGLAVIDCGGVAAFSARCAPTPPRGRRRDLGMICGAMPIAA